MASYWRELKDCESDKELVRAGLAYFAGTVIANCPRVPVEAVTEWADGTDWEYALKHRRLWVLVEEDDSQNEE